MIRFLTQARGPNGDNLDLNGAYLVGSDGVPIRAEIEWGNGEIRCNKRVTGPAALSLLWNVPPFGAVMLETTRVMDRDRPYILPVELARGRLMRISQKREDWGLFDYPGADDLYARVDEAKSLFVASMTAGSESAADEKGCEAVRAAVEVGEALSLFHAGIFLERRRAAKQFSPRPMGCGVTLRQADEAYRERLARAFDFVALPTSWGVLEPRQGSNAWDLVDPWIAWATKNKLAIRAAPLISFHKSHIPDWLHLYEQDFETVRDLVGAHVRRTVQRLRSYVWAWDVVSGLHAYNPFNYSHEQLVDLTRMCTLLVKQIAPRSTAIVDIVAPWGEYYARNPRTVPPLLFADMLAVAGINFDAFGLQFYFGVPVDGMFVRDMMQISAMIDRFANFGKPLHITAVQVPSGSTTDPTDHWRGAHAPAAAGQWHAKWSEAVQAEWLERFLEIVLSKPFVETVTWRDLADTDGHYLPHGGLLRRDLAPKAAYDQLLVLRNQWLPGRDAARPRK